MEKRKATKKQNTGTALSITFLINMVLLSFHFGPLLGSAYAAETLAANLTLQKTTIKTSDTSVALAAVVAKVFSPTIINCPGKAGTCTVRIEVSAQFSTPTPGDVITCGVTIDGARDGIHPHQNVTVEDTAHTGFSASARTFTWMKSGLAPGSHTVDVEFNIGRDSPRVTNMGFRTLTIQVYK